MNEVTITLPAIDAQVIANLDNLNTIASATEIEALKAIRETYATLAKQNGHVRIGWTKRGDGSNWSQERDYYYEHDGHRVKALKVWDGFAQPNTSQYEGDNTGDRLYLLETVEWLRIERTGTWSNWQGAPCGWSCGDGIVAVDGDHWMDEMRQKAARAGYADPVRAVGSIRLVTDAEVNAEYDLDEIVVELGKSLNTLADKLPARMTGVQRRVALANQLLAGLK
jgi:hypothetical protein